MFTQIAVEGFPFNLILAVATASATIFTGFLPTKTIRSTFFARETLKAAFGWICVALMTPPAIMHYPVFFALLCGGAWWKFSRDSALSGKLWLSLASGLGISMGVMLILAITPQAYPPHLAQIPQTLLLASIYLGGGVIGLAYVCASLALNVSTRSGVPQAIVQRYVGLLVVLTMARAAVLVAMLMLTPGLPGHVKVAEQVWPATNSPVAGNQSTDLILAYAQDIQMHASDTTLLLLGLVVLMPVLAIIASLGTRFSSRIKPAGFLIAICLFGILAETLARILVL